MRAKTVDVFKFDELSDRAKETAREWYRQGALDYDWYDCVYEDATQCAAILGIDINKKPVKLMSGAMRYDPAIYFSGFSSQGDGAAFEASYSYAKGASKKIRQHAPQDADLHAIADALQIIQRKSFYRLAAQVRTTGRYFNITVDTCDSRTGDNAAQWQEDDIASAMQDFAHWIYRQLKCEHEYLLSDEQVDELIAANDYEFAVDGTLA